MGRPLESGNYTNSPGIVRRKSGYDGSGDLKNSITYGQEASPKSIEGDRSLKKLRVWIAACLALTLLAACGQNAPTWQEQYDLGVRYLSEGNYEEAILAFTAAIEIDPKRAEAYISLADAYLEQVDTAQAESTLRLGLEQLPEDAELLAKLEALAPAVTPEPTPGSTAEPTPEPTDADEEYPKIERTDLEDGGYYVEKWDESGRMISKMYYYEDGKIRDGMIWGETLDILTDNFIALDELPSSGISISHDSMYDFESGGSIAISSSEFKQKISDLNIRGIMSDDTPEEVLSKLGLDISDPEVDLSRIQAVDISFGDETYGHYSAHQGWENRIWRVGYYEEGWIELIFNETSVKPKIIRVRWTWENEDQTITDRGITFLFSPDDLSLIEIDAF